jgi:hypothetical protein
LRPYILRRGAVSRPKGVGAQFIAPGGLRALVCLLVLAASPLFAARPGAGAAGAPLDRDEFRYARRIGARAPGLATLTLDPAALAHGSLDDLRIADAGGRQIPYLLEQRAEPLVLRLAAPEPLPEGRGGESRYRLRLPYAALPAATLVLTTPGRVFEREVRLLRPDRRRGRSLAWATWRHDEPGLPAPPLELALPARAGSVLDLIVDEGDNAPLPLGPPQLRLDTWRLRFFHPGGEGLQLLYGRDGLGPPRYDLGLLAPRLRGAEASEVTLGPEPPGEEDGAGGSVATRNLFWVSLVAAVLVLLLVLARLMREQGPPPPRA